MKLHPLALASLAGVSLAGPVDRSQADAVPDNGMVWSNVKNELCLKFHGPSPACIDAVNRCIRDSAVPKMDFETAVRKFTLKQFKITTTCVDRLAPGNSGSQRIGGSSNHGDDREAALKPRLEPDATACGNSASAHDGPANSSEECLGTVLYCLSKRYAAGLSGSEPAKEASYSPAQCLRDRGIEMASLESRPKDRHWWDIDARREGEKTLVTAWETYRRSALFSILAGTVGVLEVDDAALESAVKSFSQDPDKVTAEELAASKNTVADQLREQEASIQAKLKDEDEPRLRAAAERGVDEAKQALQRTYRREFMHDVAAEIDRLHVCLQRELEDFKAAPLAQVEAPADVARLLRASSGFARRERALRHLGIRDDADLSDLWSRQHLDLALRKIKGLPDRAAVEERVAGAREALNKKWDELRKGEYFKCRLDTGFASWRRKNGQEWKGPLDG